MKSIKQWFSLGPDDEYEGRKYHWYNKTREWQNERVKLVLGDMHQLTEYENGGDMGPAFSVELALCQEDIPEFDLADNPRAAYDIHWMTVVIWRWGFYLSIRGRVK